MKIKSKVEVLELIFDCVVSKEFGKITVECTDETHQAVRYHTNIFQRIVNKIFGTSYQTLKTYETRYVITTLTTSDNKQYTQCIEEIDLDNMDPTEIANEIIKPQLMAFMMALKETEK